MKISISDANMWEEYRKRVPKDSEPDPEDWASQRIREIIIDKYLPLTKLVAGAMKKGMPEHVNRDDLISQATIGLLQAVRRYNHTLGVPFEAFANQRMRSVIMDEIRNEDWAPRSLRRRKRLIDKAEDAFRRDGHEPTEEEVAERLDLSVKEVSDTKYEAEIAAHTYIEGNIEAQNMPARVDHDEYDLVEMLKGTLAKSLQRLPVRKAAIIALHYYDNKKLSEIAEMLSVSDVRIGTLHAEAVLQLWGELEKIIKSA